ncbi:hypothetical protein CWI38_0452p0010 [Hamiltosporidium tvaerminnensis]|uniref:Uncharacterized protein n=1 Tax=Hamiltosporidium tvaerminnensis TaxID=1176355 RepID=A0A4Q9LXF0_9MICR|nr:hypothetical protein CWI38_0452p0010 [Hamiltosporidium tvaerminnensis]
MFIYNSIERDIIFNVVNENEESYIALINNELKLECLCQIKREVTIDTDEKNCLERMLVRNSKRQHELYNMEFIKRFGLKFDIFEKFNKINNNVEIFLCHHIKKSDFLIFYEYTLDEIKELDLNIAKFIVQSLKHTYQQYSIEEPIKENEKIPKENGNFHLKLIKEDNFKGKIRIIEYLECKNNNLQVKCFYEYKRFFYNRKYYLEENIESIKIPSSEIKSDFLRDILNIKGLESLEINHLNIYIENEIFLNESIKYFKFWLNNDNDCYSIFQS